MQRLMLKSKIQEAKITSTEIHYDGSIAIDLDLLDAAGIKFGEQVHIYDVTNGNRIITYAIPAPKGSGVVSVKGAAGHLIKENDIILVVAFGVFEEDELDNYTHRIVYVDGNNCLVRVDERTQEDYLNK